MRITSLSAVCLGGAAILACAGGGGGGTGNTMGGSGHTSSNAGSAGNAGDASGSQGGNGPGGDAGSGGAAAGRANGGAAAGGRAGADGGTGGAQGGAVGVGGATGGGGAGGNGGDVQASFISNTPSAVVTQTPVSSDAQPLIMISSNLVYSPSGNEYFTEWFGVVRNTGTVALCFVQVELSFQVQGTVVEETAGFADAPAYLSDIVVPCIPPGGIGIVYDNGFITTPPDLNDIDVLDILLEGHDYGDQVPHPLDPNLNNVMITEPYGAGTGYWGLVGDLQAVGTINNVLINAYPRDDAGLAYAKMIAVTLDTITTGSSWAFETTTANAPFTEYDAYVEFEPGAAAAAFQLGGSSESRAEKLALDEQRRTQKQALSERQAQAQ